MDCLQNLSIFGDHVCPCGRAENGLRRLTCATGACTVCRSMRAQLQVCEEQSAFEHLPVKYRWLRPIKIGNRNESEWAYDSKPYPEFMQLMEQYFENTYRMHNWVYKMQDKERHNCRDRLQPGHVILEFDYAAKATQFQQDVMKCSAARQLSNFILFAHTG